MDKERLLAAIREVADFPQHGILFRDVSPLLRDPHLLNASVGELVRPFLDQQVTAVAGIEARGFIFGSLVASALSVGFVPLRKSGKLPSRCYSVHYDLEYGRDSLQLQEDALVADDRVLLIDDLLATGGTARAASELIGRSGASLIGAAFLVELAELGGRGRLPGTRIHTVLDL